MREDNVFTGVCLSTGGSAYGGRGGSAFGGGLNLEGGGSAFVGRGGSAFRGRRLCLWREGVSIWREGDLPLERGVYMEGGLRGGGVSMQADP